MSDAAKIDLNKLRSLVVEHTGPGKEFTRRKLSLAASEGRNPDLIRDLMRVDKRHPTFETAIGICRALGVDPSQVVKGVPLALADAEWLTVCGEVQAGVWREYVDWQDDDCFQIKVGPPAVDGDRYGMRVEGRSMDKTLPPGTILECVRLIGSGIEAQDGDYVIADRVRDGLHEFTCKKLSRRPDGNYELVAESNQPEFAKPLFIGKPDEFLASENETRVVAVVVRAHLQLFSRPQRRELAA